MNPCACRYDQKDGIRFCPLHAAAEEMLDACVKALGAFEFSSTGDGGALAKQVMQPILRAAVKRAQGGLDRQRHGGLG